MTNSFCSFLLSLAALRLRDAATHVGDDREPKDGTTRKGDGEGEGEREGDEDGGFKDDK